jgi:dynein heavy chain 2, cytosolic
VAFLQQLLAHGGFYDDHREFVHVERVQLVVTASSSVSGGGGVGGGGVSPGRHPLSPRFTGALRVVAVDAPPPSELAAICTACLQAAAQGRHQPIAPAGLARLASALVDVYATAATPSASSLGSATAA